MPFTIRIRQSQLRRFQKWAKEYFPREIIAGMGGTWFGKEILEIDYISSPVIGTEFECFLPDHHWKKEFKDREFVGDIHTHPNEWGNPKPSSYDIEQAANSSDMVFAVCNVWINPNTNKLYTRTKIYPTGPRYRVEQV